MITGLKALAVALLLLAFAGKGLRAQDAQTSTPQTLSYQGVLKTTTGNQTAGNRLLKVTLYSDADGNNKLWQNTMNTLVDENGVFNTLLGTPDNPLPSSADMDRPIWLGLSIDNGPELRPLSQITASAYALNVADNAITSQKLATGAVTADKLDMNYVSSISVNGQKVTGKASDLNIVSGDGVDLVYDDASKVLLLNTSGSAKNTGGKGANAETVSTEWELAGNTTTVPGTDYLGTTDNKELYIKVNATQVMRFIPTASVPNIIGGDASNSIASCVGAVISGGKSNEDTSDYAAISGGQGNRIQANAPWGVEGGGRKNLLSPYDTASTIGGGDSNTVSDRYGVVAGGQYNVVGANAQDADDHYSAIVGGLGNFADEGYAFIGGGHANQALGIAFNTITGGERNKIDIGGGPGTQYGFIGGGRTNTIVQTTATIAGGDSNIIGIAGDQGDSASFIGGGRLNFIPNGTLNAITGGYANFIQDGLYTGSGFGAIAGGESNKITAHPVGLNWHPNDHSFIGGGEQNEIQPDHAAIGGGQNNLIDTLAHHSFIGGGEANLLNKLANHSTLGGGFYNVIKDSFAVLVGGDSNTVQGPWSFLGGGQHNMVGDAGSAGLEDSFCTAVGGRSNWAEEEYSAIVGGQGNQTMGTYGFIGSGFQNLIDDENLLFTQFSTIGGGFRNWERSEYNAIIGGDSNTIMEGANYGIIGGGLQNLIDTNSPWSAIGGGEMNHVLPNTAPYGTIPGGDSLIANSFAQTVIGYNNAISGTFAQGNPHAGSDIPLFIIGNGNNSGSRSDAFEVSYDGHSTVHDLLGTGTLPTRLPILGSTYQDNVVYAWGDITGAALAGPCNGSVTINSAFGIAGTVMYVCKGQYRVQLNTSTNGSTLAPLTNGFSVTATPVVPIIGSPSCRLVVVTPLGTGGGPHTAEQFDIFLLDPSSSCAQVDGEIMFQVCGRP